MTRFFVMSCMALALSGCSFFNFSGDGDGVADVTLPFRASLSKGEDPRDFTIFVRAGGNGLEAVRETVRFTATRYCLPVFGGSDVDWVIDPATLDWAFSREGDDLVFAGRCLAR
ncbi:MAG: hypothetical protein ABJF50_19370 [Paracoccaceae bacterium]